MPTQTIKEISADKQYASQDNFNALQFNPHTLPDAASIQKLEMDCIEYGIAITNLNDPVEKQSEDVFRPSQQT